MVSLDIFKSLDSRFVKTVENQLRMKLYSWGILGAVSISGQEQGSHDIADSAIEFMLLVIVSLIQRSRKNQRHVI